MLKQIERVIVAFFFLCIILLHAAVADTGTAASPFQTVFDDIVHLFGYTLSIVILALFTGIANKLYQKYGIQVPTEWLNRTLQVIDQGIAYAEEQARKAGNSSAISGNEKLNTALAFVLKIVGDDKKLVALGEEKIKQMIEARLNQTRQVPLIAATLETENKEEGSTK